MTTSNPLDTPPHFQAHLEQFHGPLDLLLYLIKQNEVEITDLPIVKITDQYLEMVETLKAFDPDQASQFLVLASTLIEIKSKTLLPREEVDFSDIEDPRSDLIQQLLAYREFKEQAKTMNHLRMNRLLRFPRGESWNDESSDELSLDLGDMEVWDLFSLFQKVLEETLVDEVPLTVSYDEITIEEHMNRVIQQLLKTPNKTCGFLEMARSLTSDRVQLVGLFFSLLELTRLKRVRLVQPRDFVDIHIVGADDLQEGEVPTLESQHEENFSEEADPEQSLENNQETDQEITLEFSSEDKSRGASEIDGFYNSNYRQDRDRLGSPDQAMNGVSEEDLDLIDSDDEAAPSLDVNADDLSVLKERIPAPILDPAEDDLVSWRAQRLTEAPSVPEREE